MVAETRYNLPPIDRVTGRRLRYGNGCAICNNCFECPFPDCRYNTSNDYYMRKEFNANTKTA